MELRNAHNDARRKHRDAICQGSKHHDVRLLCRCCADAVRMVCDWCAEDFHQKCEPDCYLSKMATGTYGLALSRVVTRDYGNRLFLIEQASL